MGLTATTGEPVNTTSTPAHRAYELFCIENKREPNDRERFAFVMGWYDGRIALQLQHNEQRAQDFRDHLNAITRERGV